MESGRGESTMKWSECFLGVVGTILVGVACYYIDEHDRKITLTTPEITVHGHSSTN